MVLCIKKSPVTRQRLGTESAEEEEAYREALNFFFSLAHKHSHMYIHVNKQARGGGGGGERERERERSLLTIQ
jgi:hypothetical protein